MHSVLLVDDEAHIVDSLLRSIDWTSLGIDRVAGAYGASDAIRSFENDAFDILVTDLKMPGMGGLELIERLRTTSPELRCIILTGHADFQFARRAIDNKVDKYLLKPVRDSVLEDSIRNIVADLRQHAEAVTLESSIRNVFHEHLLRLRFKTLTDYAVAEPGQSPANEHMKTLGLGRLCASKQVFAVFIAVRSSERQNGGGISARSSLSLLEKRMNECLEPDMYWVPCEDQHGNLVILVKGPDVPVSGSNNRRDVGDCIQKLLSGSKIHGASCRVNTSDFQHTIQALLLDHAAWIRGMRAHVAPGAGTAATVGDQHRVAGVSVFLQTGEIDYLLRSRQWSEARSRIEHIFSELRSGREFPREYLLELLFPVVSTLIRIAHRFGESVAHLCETAFYDLVERISRSSLPEVEEAFFRVFDSIRAHLDAHAGASVSGIVEASREYVHCNIANPITVQHIADAVSVTQSYLSETFKSETGENISNYIFRIRMDAASELLSSTTLPVSEVGSRVGYPNPAYFSAVFRKYHGVTPRAYRSGSD